MRRRDRAVGQRAAKGASSYLARLAFNHDHDPARFGEQASDVFFKVQAAWSTRDMRGAGAVVTPEMTDILQKDSDRLRAQGRVNRLENIAVRSVTLTEAWQEGGQDYVTVRFLASLL